MIPPRLQRIVVFGGTGFVGRSVCTALAAAAPGCRVVVPTRRRGRGREVLPLPNVDLVAADVHDEQALPGLLAGADAVVQLVAILHGDEAAFERVHGVLQQRIAAACRSAGVRRVVQVSALGVAADAPSAYLRSKARGEAVWTSSGLDVTVLRPSVIFGEADRFTNLFARLQRLAPLLPLAGADSQYQPVWVEDVAAAVVACLRDASTLGRTIECAGPQVLSLAQIVRAVGRMAGCERPVVPVPEAVGRLQALLLGMLPGEPLMSADNLLSMRVPNVASGRLPGLDSLAIRPAPLSRLQAHFARRRSPGRA